MTIENETHTTMHDIYGLERLGTAKHVVRNALNPRVSSCTSRVCLAYVSRLLLSLSVILTRRLHPHCTLTSNYAETHPSIKSGKWFITESNVDTSWR